MEEFIAFVKRFPWITAGCLIIVLIALWSGRWPILIIVVCVIVYKIRKRSKDAQKVREIERYRN